MKRNLTYTILLCGAIKVLVASITGVTYMDHFNFEQRYRDVNECNPFYWHPLHLPQECVQMFENLMRSRLNTLSPYRIVKERSVQAPAVMYPYNYIYSPIITTEYKPDLQYLPVERKTPSQYEILYELLKRDVQDLPSVPFLGVSPHLGVIAMYKQPVSYKSAAMIKKLARAYDTSNLFTNMQTGIKNTDTHQENKIKTNTKNSNGNLVVDSVKKGNDAIALLKIKKFN
ncbi:uncharacterized protein LOC120636604 [Pararge aegeria]|uniref:Jg305 protein n=1 Tax=Pararge aegeria aegeria TaxID=348720 RepID=A0A8S4QVR8_9NEOP|nr:uncharacterized protein LOC120636604 [Pararge aegeria]CAH2226332.1 jg305 [Pararge aegeria aegeria]